MCVKKTGFSWRLSYINAATHDRDIFDCRENHSARWLIQNVTSQRLPREICNTCRAENAWPRWCHLETDQAYRISLYPEALKQKQHKIEGIFQYTQCVEALQTFQALELLNLMINGYRVESQLQQGGGGTPATHRFIEFNRQSTQIIGFLVGKSKVSLLIHDDQW